MIYSGSGVSPGLAMGKAFVYIPFIPVITADKIQKEHAPAELLHYHNVRDQATTELECIVRRLGQSYNAKIFTAQTDILLDCVLEEEITRLIEEDLYNAAYAIYSAFEKYACLLENVNDTVISQRALDIRDVKNRLLRILYGVKEIDITNIQTPIIIVAHNLTPSDTASFDRNNVLAIVSETGGETSHVAILAKSWEIPAILGVEGITNALTDDDYIIVDASNGTVYTHPSDKQIKSFTLKRDSFQKELEILNRYRSEKTITPDGIEIEIHLNIGSDSEHQLENAQFADGVGLFRTEFLFLEGNRAPSEDEQFESYRKVLARFGQKPVILRTLDFGGDKEVNWLNLPKEENPFLGNRALRLCFTRPDMFKTQLRAALRASVYGNLWIMFPMVSAIDDIRRAKSFVCDVKKELQSENIPINNSIKTGIMIETPSIALMSDAAAEEVDFASLGTNDLCQYLMAADRGNPSVHEWYQHYNPAVFRLIGYVTEEFTKRGNPISICGEMGSDTRAAAVLIGLGMRKLSVGAASIARIKRLITQLPYYRAKELALIITGMSTDNEVREFLDVELKEF
ncbi:MAG: phosphoenolpyruvate--protein phosphotransferase [Oscillospiraceae bacterium]|nr:phosphoenolpyruvate--protein phosphotransferase [Oscillospiraceae bacterium]